jgi:hypothetical protein
VGSDSRSGGFLQIERIKTMPTNHIQPKQKRLNLSDSIDLQNSNLRHQSQKLKLVTVFILIPIVLPIVAFVMLVVLFATMTAFGKLWARIARHFPINDWGWITLGFDYNWLGLGGWISKNDRQLSLKITGWLTDFYRTNWGKCLRWSSYRNSRH